HARSWNKCATTPIIENSADHPQRGRKRKFTAPPANDHPGAIRPPRIHDLHRDFISRESKIRQDYLDRVNQFASEAAQ
ncbi:MAG TPA: hypothetical protein VIL70_02740, partial [Chthoniobacterales bacterium]